MRDWPSLSLAFPPAADSTLQDLVTASLDADAVAAIEERTPSQWLVSFRDAAARDAAAAALVREWAASGLVVDVSDVSDGDWARRSQAALGPVRVGRIVVSPPWCAPATDESPGTVRVVIEPSMGFGSGHHATTRLCLDVLQTLCVAGARVVDIGTGSGVLAIAAAKLGAASVVGIDNDADALETARAGADANGPLAGLTFQQGDFRVSHLGPADIVLANLTGGMLLASVDALVRTVAPSGHLVLSGITAAEAEAVRNAYASVMDVVWDREQDEWVGLVLQAWGSLASVR